MAQEVQARTTEHAPGAIADPHETVRGGDWAVSINNLTAGYGRPKRRAQLDSSPNSVIDIDNFNVPKNQITALIGASGCGKSTLLRVINRLHEVTPGATVKGEVLIMGQDIYGRDVDPVAVRKLVGMVFQKPNPFPTMSIYDNVRYGLTTSGWKGNKSERDARIKELLSRVGLWDEVQDKLGQSGEKLSGGQQQRLCIARALAADPKILLLDEPCSSLDPISTLEIEDLLYDLKQDYSMIIVTHNMQQAARISDRTAFMYAEPGQPGRIIEYGVTAQVFNNPRIKRTEDYVTGRFG